MPVHDNRMRVGYDQKWATTTTYHFKSWVDGFLLKLKIVQSINLIGASEFRHHTL